MQHIASATMNGEMTRRTSSRSYCPCSRCACAPVSHDINISGSIARPNKQRGARGYSLLYTPTQCLERSPLCPHHLWALRVSRNQIRKEGNLCACAELTAAPLQWHDVRELSWSILRKPGSSTTEPWSAWSQIWSARIW